MALCHGLCPAQHGRDFLVRVQWGLQALLCGAVDQVRRGEWGRTGSLHRAQSGQCRLAHAQGVAGSEGLRLEYLPPYSPELQPAERLWGLVDEPLVNQHFARLSDLEAVVAERCRRLDHDRPTIKAHAHFHWWPKSVTRN